jgi:Tol biopolymer transport system component
MTVKLLALSGSLLLAIAIPGHAVRLPSAHLSRLARGERLRPGPALLSYVASNGGSCLVRADGSHAVRVTPRWRTYLPAWSPGGRYLAFGRPTGTEQSKIFVADTRGHVRWTFGAGSNNGGPLWSPDGRNIEYVSAWAHIYSLSVAHPDGSGEHGLAGSPGFPTYGPEDPAWTPDGQRLAFDDGNDLDAPQGIFSVIVDGGDRRLLVAHARQPAYSPDGSTLAYVGLRFQPSVIQPTGIFVAKFDGSSPRPLTTSKDASTPRWSPDGTRLSFVRGQAVVVVRADGSGERVISTSPPASAPVWSPGGKLLAFARYKRIGGGPRVISTIVVARTDGGGERVIVRHVGKTYQDVVAPPVWRPAVALPPGKRLPCTRR